MLFPTRSAIGLLAAAVTATPAFAEPGHDHNHNHDAKPPAAAAAPAPGAAKPAAAGKATPAAKPAPAAKPVKLPAGVMARVNGQNITRADLLSTLDTLGGQPLLRQMITVAILEQEAKRLGVTVTDAELKKAVEEAKHQVVSQAMMNGRPGTFAEIAARDGITEGLVRYTVRQNLLAQKAFAKSAESQVPKLESQIKASHILIATVPLQQPTPDAKPPTAEETKKREEEARKKIDGILADIRAGKTSFAAAAKEQSDDKGSGAQGGDLGWFGKGMMDPAFEKTAFALTEAGQISDPVKSQFGWHIILLEKKGATATAEEKANFQKSQIERMTQSGAMRAWMGDLVNKATIITNTGGAQAAAAAPARTAGSSPTPGPAASRKEANR